MDDKTTEDINDKQKPSLQKKQGKKKRVFVLVAIIFVCLVLGAGAGVQIYRMYVQGPSITERQALENDGNKVITQDEAAIADIVAKVSPSVVSILTTGDDPFGVVGAGTGVIVSSDGYVMTNKHVVNGSKVTEIALSNGTTYENIELVGVDPLNDIAFLKIQDVNNLPAAQLGDSSSIRVGQSVVAIGNSLGLYQNTVTTGIISGTGRPVSAQDGEAVQELTDLIQTDAAINPGNSGGPLLNLSGQVIGINTAIVEDAQGIGFAIPINATKGLLKGVYAGRGVKRAYLGVQYLTITASVAKEYGLPVTNGAFLKATSGSAVVRDSPAARAGLKEGDIITKVNGLVVGEAAGLSSLVAEYAPDDVIELTVLRDGGEQMVTVTLGEYQR